MQRFKIRVRGEDNAGRRSTKKDEINKLKIAKIVCTGIEDPTRAVTINKKTQSNSNIHYSKNSTLPYDTVLIRHTEKKRAWRVIKKNLKKNKKKRFPKFSRSHDALSS